MKVSYQLFMPAGAWQNAYKTGMGVSVIRITKAQES
jgi:hypothetical protein